MLDDSPPEPTPVPGEPKTMRVAQQFILDEDACDETTSPPDFDSITFTPNADGSLLLDYGSGTFTLYSDDNGYYEYNTGNNAAVRLNVALVLYSGGTEGSISWSSQADYGKPNCFVTRDLVLPGAEPPLISTPDAAATASPAEDNPQNDSSDLQLLPGLYEAAWIELPGLCADAALGEIAPHFAEVRVSLPDAASALVDSTTWQSLLNMAAPGTYFAIAMDEELNSSTSLSAGLAGSASFSWSAAGAKDSSKSCVVMATLTKIAD
jgi:hypothetical protein